MAMICMQQQNTVEQPHPQDTLVYADIGPSSFKNRGKPKVTPSPWPVDTDDRVEYALLNHSLQKPAITTIQDSIAGIIESSIILKVAHM